MLRIKPALHVVKLILECIVNTLGYFVINVGVQVDILW